MLINQETLKESKEAISRGHIPNFCQLNYTRNGKDAKFSTKESKRGIIELNERVMTELSKKNVPETDAGILIGENHAFNALTCSNA